MVEKKIGELETDVRQYGRQIKKSLAERDKIQTRIKRVEVELAKKRVHTRDFLIDTSSDIENVTKLGLGAIDHIIDIIKFIIGLSATGVFTAIGLSNAYEGSYELLALSTVVLIVAIIYLVNRIDKRRKLVDRIVETYQARIESAAKLHSVKEGHEG